VVDLELYRPVTSPGLMDADQDPLERFERVTEIQERLPSGVADADLASFLVLGDGRRAWGGAGAYESGHQFLKLSRPANSSCPEAAGETLAWMTVYGTQVITTTIAAQLGSASVEFPVTVLPAQ